MPNIREAFDPGALSIRPSETGVEATAATARRVGAFSNQQAGATETLARETERLSRETDKLGSETAGLGRQTEGLGRETGQLGDFEGHLLTDTGRRAGSAIEAAGDQAVKYLDHQQISHGALAFSQMMARKTAEWNGISANADPNDPTTAQKFMAESLEPDLEKFQQQGFYTENGQKWAEAHVDALRKHFVEKTSADMSTNAAHAAKTNAVQTINTLSNTVRSDPSSLDFSLAALDSGLEGRISTSPNLTGPDAARVRFELRQQGKESIIKSAALGYIEKTGQVPEWTTDPKYSPYINGGELKQFAQAAKYYQHQNEIAVRGARAEVEHNARTQFNTDVNNLELSLYDKDGNPAAGPQHVQRLNEIVQNNPVGAALEPGRVRTMQEGISRVIDRMNKPEPLGRVSHDTTMQLLADIRSGAITDNGPIYKAFSEDKLNRADFKFINDELSNLKTPEGAALGKTREEFFKRYAASVDGAMDFGGHSALGSQRMYQFEMDARRQEADLRKKGLDPHSIYDPSSANFIGKQENVARYHVSMQEAQAFEKTIKGEKGPAPPAGAKPAPETVITSKEQYDKLPSNTPFTWNNKKFIKP